MDFVWFELEDGRIVTDWNLIDGRIKSIKMDIVTLGISNNPPLVLLSGYEKYMYQKYGVCGIGLGAGKESVVPFAGLQIGGCRDGCWVIIDVSLLERLVRIELKNKITSIAVKEGVF
jgi:hypothetical protein